MSDEQPDLEGDAEQAKHDDATVKPLDRTLSAGGQREARSTVKGPAETYSGESTSGETIQWKPSSPERSEVSQSGAFDQATARTMEFQGAVDESVVYEVRPLKRPLPKAIGVYDIRRELGRGGMGVVYLARHRVLDRDVALKMVLDAAHANADQLVRFSTEARAVAHLQHPNIVQIFEVGEHDGLPFFSLEYVNGPSLKDRQEGKPLPPEEAAQIVEKLARAMQYAHDHQILHRDLKPANVLMTGAGVPKISDFGLAKRLSEEGDSASTRTGTVMGTPSYMSPEQARGDIKLLTPATDQYSLGAVLYELLTGRPPFLAARPVDTILQVLKDEPIPPRRSQPTLPSDIETICLKALQKEPFKRYVDCSAFADDLRRFLVGEPILARPVGKVERVMRWCRRNPRQAVSAAVAVLLLITTAVVSTASAIVVSAKNAELSEASARIKQEAENAKAQERIAAREAANAKQQELLAQRHAGEEAKARKLADENALVAGQQATLALNALQTLVDQVQKLIGNTPGTHELKRSLLSTAMDGLTKVAASADKSTSKEATMAAAHMQMGRLFKQLGSTAKAYEQFERCYAITKERVKIKEGSDASRSNLAASCITMGEMSQDLHRDMEASLNFYQEAVAIYRDILERPKAAEGRQEPYRIKLALSEAQTRVGATIFRLGDPEKAVEHFKNALALREELEKSLDEDPDIAKLEAARKQALRYELGNSRAKSYLAIGNLHFRRGRFSEAEPHYQRSLDLRESLFADYPKLLSAKGELGRVVGMMGEFLFQSGKSDAALPYFQRACALSEEVMKADPKVVEYRRDLGIAYYRLGQWQVRRGEDGRTSFEKSRDIRATLAQEDAENDRRRMEWMLALAHCGGYEQAAQLAMELRRSKSVDSELLVDIARCFAQCFAAVSATNDALARQYRSQAIDAIRSAVDLGFKDWTYFKVEADLDPLRGHAEFTTLLPTS